MKRFILFATVLTAVVYHPLSAQTIRGTITDNKAPVEFANVFVFTTADTTKPLTTMTTDSVGGFQVSGLAYNNYLIKVQMIGYLPQSRTATLDARHPDAALGNINLAKDATVLHTVAITGQKQLLKKTTNGFIVDARDNITQAGGTATDLLRSTPTVVVDAEGAITIRGKSPLILVNGRNSNLSNTDRIPASSIESIEIINNPSARYDADAEGGIINITLKKNKLEGTSGSVVVGTGYGAKGRANSAAQIGHQQGNWNLGLAYDDRFAGRTRNVDALRTNFGLPDEYYLVQNRHDNRFEQTQNLKFNADYTPNERNSLGIELVGNMDGQDNRETLVSMFQKQDLEFENKNSRLSNEIERENALEGALNYQHTFADKRKSLQASASTSFNFDRQNTDITTTFLTVTDATIGDPYLQRTHNYENNNVSNFRVDYVTPIGLNNTLEIGYKGILRYTNTDFLSSRFLDNSYVPDPKASNIFDFREQVHAAYFQLKGAVGAKDSTRWKYDVGLRVEQVNNNGHTVNTPISFTNNYRNFFPSGNLAYYINQNDLLRLTFSRRINRPGLGQLNPFTDITDSLNPHSGNPYLQPELVNALEAGYNKEWKKASVSANVFYRYATNIIRSFISVDSNSAVALTRPANFGNATTYGFETIASAYPTKFWSLNASFSLFQQQIDGSNVSLDATGNLLSWYGKLINNFMVCKGGKLQIIGVYNSPTATPQGTRLGVYNVDLGFQQKLAKGNIAIGLVVTDIFNTVKNGFTASDADFTYSRTFKSDTRAALVTFAYSFRTKLKEELMQNKFSND